MSNNKEKLTSYGPSLKYVQNYWGDENRVMEWFIHDMKPGIINSIKKEINQEISKLSNDARILDVACGPNPFDYFLNKKLNIFMLDVSPEMLKLNSFSNRVVADAREPLPFPDNSFELITCIFGMKYIQNQSEVVTDMLRVLKPSGTAILIDNKQKKSKTGKPRQFMDRKNLEKYLKGIKKRVVESRVIVKPIFGFPRVDLIKFEK